MSHELHSPLAKKIPLEHAAMQGCQIFLDKINQNGEKYTKIRKYIPKLGEIYQTGGKYTKLPLNFQIGRIIFQKGIKYTKLFQIKALQNLPKL
jgi:hypothetical protein